MKRSDAAARRMLLRRLLSGREISSQQELVRQLARRGHRVTQTTVSRDLAAIGAEKRAAGNGGERYVLPRAAGPGRRRLDLARILREFVLDIEHSRNLVLLKTPPGAASPVAAALDRAALEAVLGTVAGDDTVLVITRDANGGSTVARELSRTMEVR